MDNTIGLNTARKGRYFILSKVVYDKRKLVAGYAAVETRSLHKANSQNGWYANGRQHEMR